MHTAARGHIVVIDVILHASGTATEHAIIAPLQITQYTNVNLNFLKTFVISAKKVVFSTSLLVAAQDILILKR